MEFLEHGRTRDRGAARWNDPGCYFRPLVTRLIGRSKVALTRPHRHPRLVDLEFELVDFAVEGRGRKADQVLAAQLLRDARERRGQVGGLRQLEVTAAGLIRNLAQVA